MSHLKYSRSLFLDSQVPAYIRAEYPLFLAFIKQYYSYLDRSIGQLVAAKITNKGRNYSNGTTITLQIIDSNQTSATYGMYVSDYKGAIITPYVVNGRIEKLVVANFGSGYIDSDAARILIADSTGSGAEAAAIIVRNIGNINQATKEVISIRDIDEEFEMLFEYIINEYIPTFPRSLYTSSESSVETAKFIKFIRQFYNATGIESSVKFLYRVLLNTDVSFYYPKTDMLRVSDGKWNIDRIINIVPAVAGIAIDDYRQNYVGHRILSESGTTAIIQTINESVVSATNCLEMIVSNVNGLFDPAGNETITDYPITGVGQLIGSSIQHPTYSAVLYTTEGYYIGNDGTLSSQKRIQDSLYYQDFSYELQSDASVKEFKNLIEHLVHPAGLKYFTRLNLFALAEYLNGMDVDSETNVNIGPDVVIEVISDPMGKNLGPMYSDIDANRAMSLPDSYVDFTGTTTIPNPYTSFAITTNAAYLGGREEFNNFSAIFTQGVNTWYRRIIAFDPSTKTVTIDSALGTPAPSADLINYRVIENLRLTLVTNASSTLTLSTYDPGYEQNTSIINATDHWYVRSRIYITSGPGAGAHKTIITFDGDTGIITYDSPFTVAPTTDSTYYILRDFYNNTGYYTGRVDAIFLTYGGTGYTAATVTIAPPLSGTTATATATVTSGAVTNLTITDPGSGYTFNPIITINGTSTIQAMGYVTIDVLSSSYSSNIYKYSKLGGVILQTENTGVQFVTATATANSSNSVVFNCSLNRVGSGYTYVPRIFFLDGGGQSAAAICNMVAGTVNSITMTNLGTDFTLNPQAVIEDSTIRTGERVIQPTTGARGIVELFDKDSGLLYILKDITSHDFDDSGVTYNGLNISIDTVVGVYNTTGKPTNQIPETDITIIKV